jgi:NitT/TauT family transport system substrate-binding protein
MIRIVRLATLAAALLLFGGCSKSPEKTSGPKGDSTAAGATPSAALGAAAPAPVPEPTGTPLKILYSDWPGWIAWDIAIQKGWFKEANVAVEFKWLDYVKSMEAYAAGQGDAVCVTNGDALVTGAGSSAPSIGIVINDYSNGNDMVVAKPGISSVAQLKGKKVGVEVGFVSHLLLMNALASANLTERDITIVNVPTDQTPQTLKSGNVDAIVAWQPNSGQALKQVPGSTAIFTSANVPGIIYDMLVVNPKSLAERRADWLKVVKVWDRIAKFMKDEKNLDEAAKIMSARVDLKPEEYKPLMKGTYILDLAEAAKRYQKADGLESVFGSSRTVDQFNVKNSVYKVPQKIEDYLDPTLTTEAMQ